MFFGVGILGKGKYTSRIGGVKTKEYELWRSMLHRCYEEIRRKRNLSYKDCSVAEVWHNFQNFAKWHEENYIKGFVLDKDILFKGNKIYSPEICCFVPPEINLLFTMRGNHRGKYPLGVSKIGNKFQSNISMDKVRKYLGIFDTPEEAFQAYKIAKELKIKDLAIKNKERLTNKCYEALMNYEININD